MSEGESSSVMESQFPHETLQRIRQCGVIATLVVDHAASAVPLARALMACGVDCVELPLQTPAAIVALKLLRDEVPEMLVGAGTVLQPKQLDEVVEAGAAFAVSTGLNPRVVQRSLELGLPFAPGVATPSDIEAAVELGCCELKFSPAQPSGGIKYLRAMYAPYAHLGLQFIPSGGMNAANMAEYLYDDRVLGIGGSWIAPRNLIQNQNWSAVIDNATEARRNVQDLRTNL